MNTKPLLTKITPHFLEDYLKACGVEDVKRYLNPNDVCFDNPFKYEGMDKAIELMEKHIKGQSKVCIVVD